MNGEISGHLGWSAKSKEPEQQEQWEHNSAHILRQFRPSHHELWRQHLMQSVQSLKLSLRFKPN